jgi:hypothetical protein
MVAEVDLDDVQRRLAVLRRLPDAPDPVLPDVEEADVLLWRFGVDEADRSDVLAARPDPHDQPELWWILNHVFHDILATMGEPVTITGFAGYPALPASSGDLGRHLPVWTFLALVPAIQRFHAARGIPDTISWTTLGTALAVALRAHRMATGASGLGLRGFGWTLPLRFRGIDYQLGRLGFHLGELSLSGGACGYVLGVHILAGERLDMEACAESIDRAHAFFARHFPDRPVAWFTCESWLLDPQLADYLDPRTNIIRFQRLFTILPLPDPFEIRSRNDEGLRGYLFAGFDDTALDRLPQDTRLRRAYVDHLRAGRHWHVRTGWRPMETR